MTDEPNANVANGSVPTSYSVVTAQASLQPTREQVLPTFKCYVVFDIEEEHGFISYSYEPQRKLLAHLPLLLSRFSDVTDMTSNHSSSSSCVFRQSWYLTAYCCLPLVAFIMHLVPFGRSVMWQWWTDCIHRPWLIFSVLQKTLQRDIPLKLDWNWSKHPFLARTDCILTHVTVCPSWTDHRPAHSAPVSALLWLFVSPLTPTFLSWTLK